MSSAAAARRVIDARALRRSNLLPAFHTVDVEEDINVVNDYFSYEHFYVRGSCCCCCCCCCWVWVGGWGASE